MVPSTSRLVSVFSLTLLSGSFFRAPSPSAETPIPEDVNRRIVEIRARALAARQSEDYQSIVREYLSLIDSVIVRRGHKEASALTSIAQGAAKELKGPWIASHIEPYVLLLKRGQKDIDEASQAMKELSSAPDDPIALGRVGRYQCLVLGRWEEGLPLLVKSGSPKLSAVAQRDLAAPTDPREQLSLGEAWLSVAAGELGATREAMRMRGYQWISRSLTSLPNDERVKIEKLLAEMPWRYLAELPELESRVGWGSFSKDGGVPGEGPIIVQGLRSPKALFLHPPQGGHSRVVYRIEKNYRTLQAHVGIVDRATNSFRGTLIFQVQGDGKMLWKSAPVVRSSVPLACRVSLAGVDLLELQVHCQGPYGHGQGVWLEPKVLR